MGIFSWFSHVFIDKKISEYQNDLMLKHYDEVENIYKQMRGWKHDYHNHIQAMRAYIALGQIDELDAYLSNLDNDLINVAKVIKSGNVMVDAILNSKIALAKSKDINVNAKATVPKDIKIMDVDLCVIIGNLIENAIEACMKIENKEDRFIRIYMGILKGQLYISVTNSINGKLNKQGKKYITSKGENHGFGLMRVDKIAQKYDGYVNRQNEEEAFATEIMLPL